MPPIESLDPYGSMWDWIASDLRFFREKEGLSLSQIGLVMGAARATVSNIEHNRPGWRLNDDQAKKLDRHWGLPDLFARLVHYARSRHEADWYVEHLQYEVRAVQQKIYELTLVPGLFQTEAYARVLFTAGGDRDPEAQVKARLARQEALTKPEPPLFWVLLDQDVIDRPIGGPEVMREQLSRLLELADLPHISIRVVPRRVGFHVGLEGAFKILTVDDHDLVYTEATGGGRLVRSASEVRSFTVRYDRIGVLALPEDSSRRLIKQAMEAIT